MTTGRKLDPTILREYDIRGVVGDTLTEADVEAIGRAFGSVAVEAGAKSVATGYDGRLSSPSLEAALARGLASTGLRVLRIGRGPTPMLYFATFHLSADAGVMVTGSHNPPDFNGLKLVLQGRAFFGPDIQALGPRAAAGDFVGGDGSEEEAPVLDAYVDRLLADLDMADDVKVAWDAGNGAAGDVLQRLVPRMPGEHILLNETVDGTFPAHHPDPTVEANLVQLKRAVRERGCDLGIAFDGDGDRIGVIDGTGRVLWGDQLLCLLAREVLAEQPGATIICDVKASQVFFDEIERLGGVPLLWKAGHSHIKTKMAETGSPLAGEMSAHIFFKHRYYGYDDALYAAIRLLNTLKATGRSLAALLDELPQTLTTPEIRFDCPEDRKFEVIEETRARLETANGVDVNPIDGVRVTTDDGWWLLRASNTQPALVVRCESADEAGMARLKAAVREQLAASGLEPPELN